VILAAINGKLWHDVFYIADSNGAMNMMIETRQS